MANLKKSCTAAAVVAALTIGAGVFTATPASAAGRVAIENVADGLFLTADGDVLLTGKYNGADQDWVLISPPGAAAGVYQIQLDGTKRCVKAVAQDDVQMADCAANPGKPQRWKVDLSGRARAIESRQYPGHVLHNDAGIVGLRPAGHDLNEQKWLPGRPPLG
ncbi:hypothetical protein OHT52_31245 [Streptomyces sp. NBC_00247]|uniref:hypothetical protein n=1 Tax=Streptomyces sp. NBC_00247 TaxID=2975689 RepID=UPI002E2BBB8E|nr:hypothetical protein [Streptomyces sp. NBC_00247]